MLTDMAFIDSKIDFRGLWRKIEIENILPFNNFNSYTLFLHGQISHVMRVAGHDKRFIQSLLSVSGNQRNLTIVFKVVLIRPDKSVLASFSLLENGIEKNCSHSRNLNFDSSKEKFVAFIHLRCLPVDATCKAIVEVAVFNIASDKYLKKLNCDVSLSRGDFASLLDGI